MKTATNSTPEKWGPYFRKRKFISLEEWQALSQRDQMIALGDFSQHGLALWRILGESGYRLVSKDLDRPPVETQFDQSIEPQAFQMPRDVHLMVGTEVGFIDQNALSELDARQKVRSFLKVLLQQEVQGI